MSSKFDFTSKHSEDDICERRYQPPDFDMMVNKDHGFHAKVSGA